MQNMHKWTGGLSDEWAFLSKGGPRGPITKAVLAFFLDKGLLHRQHFIWHTSLDSTHGRELWEFVNDWKAECLQYQGDFVAYACSTALLACLQIYTTS